MESASIGKLIRNYRQNRKVSQLELELELLAAPGSISRIETGKVNPTKETILAISKALGLKSQQTAFLLQIVPLKPHAEEILAAKAEVAEYLAQANRLAYLLDEWGVVYEVSNGFLSALGISRTTANEYLGKNLIEIVTDPNLPILKIIQPSNLIEAIAFQFARIKRDTGSKEIKDIGLNPLRPIIQKAWELSASVSVQRIISPQGKMIQLHINRETRTYMFNREPLQTNTRFKLIEYIPTGSQYVNSV